MDKDMFTVIDSSWLYDVIHVLFTCSFVYFDVLQIHEFMMHKYIQA